MQCLSMNHLYLSYRIPVGAIYLHNKKNKSCQMGILNIIYCFLMPFVLLIEQTGYYAVPLCNKLVLTNLYMSVYLFSWWVRWKVFQQPKRLTSFHNLPLVHSGCASVSTLFRHWQEFSERKVSRNQQWYRATIHLAESICGSITFWGFGYVHETQGTN